MLADTAAALGGRDRMTAVKTLVLEGEGTPEPGAGHDDGGHRADVQRDRLPARHRSGRRAHARRADAHAELRCTSRGRRRRSRSSASTATSPTPWRPTAPPRAPARRRRAIGSSELYHHPLVLVRAALDGQTTLTNLRTRRQRSGSSTSRYRRRRSASRWPSMPPATCPRASARRPTHPNLGDVVIETSFADYADESGLKLPRASRRPDGSLQDRRVAADARRPSTATPATWRRPDAASAAAVAAPRPRRVVAEVVAPGRVAARRPVAPQRARRVRRSPAADRSAAERGADAGRHRQGHASWCRASR